MKTKVCRDALSSFFAFLLLINLISCSDNSSKPEVIEPIAGTYQLEGFQINLELCYMGNQCEEGEILWRDTVQTSFMVSITLVDERKDSILFSGLKGADIAIEHPSYTGHASDETCTPNTPPDYCAYASYQENILEFNIETQPGYYYGTGELEDRELHLNTHFRHRGAGVDYVLSGLKIEN